MKILDIAAFPLRIPLVESEMPIPTETAITPVIVKIQTNEGVVGYGESYGFACAPIVAKAIESALKPVLVGMDPRNIEKIWQVLYRITYNYGRMGVMLAAISGVEIALWDILGKTLGVPVYTILGGKCRERIQAYASPLRYPNIDTLTEACKKLKEYGFTAIKPHEIEIEAVAAVREVFGNEAALMLDVNSPWDQIEVLSKGRQLLDFNLYWLEEPLWPSDDYEGLSEVRSSLPIPIAAGENEYTARGFVNLIHKKAADFIQPSIFKIGGISQVKKVFSLGQVYGKRVAPHCWSLGPALAATLHVSFSEPSCEWVETNIEHPEADILLEPLGASNGYWTIGEGEGLGIEVDENIFKEYRIQDDAIPPSFWSR